MSFAGVPSLQTPLSFFDTIPTLLNADTVTGYGARLQPQWGLYLNGQAVVIADTVVAFNYDQQWTIANYPVERGGFESYDKVNSPFRTGLRFASGGSESQRQLLLDSIVSIGDTLTLYDAVTPTEVYVGVNPGRYSYRRTSRQGLGLLVVDLELLEIREQVTGTQTQNVKDPSGYSPASGGDVQPTSADSVFGTGTSSFQTYGLTLGVM